MHSRFVNSTILSLFSPDDKSQQGLRAADHQGELFKD